LPTEPRSSSLSVTRVVSPDGGSASESLVMLHGIYGRGRNWQGIARALVAERPEYACVLVDLPYHGESGPAMNGDTVAGIASAVAQWLSEESIRPRALLGHSYGGKVALALSAHLRNQPLQIWVIDSTPEVKAPSGSAWDMLRLIRSLPARFPTREAAVSAIVDGGFTLGVGQWMGTNLSRDGDGFTWRLDFDAMERLLGGFFATDLWPVIEDAPASHEFHFVKASESSAMSEHAASRVESIGAPRAVLHRRSGGHWIHAESPEVITALLAQRLPVK
jgi:pimeloyl-ACP methyl ester carboxylesterase